MKVRIKALALASIVLLTSGCALKKETPYIEQEVSVSSEALEKKSDTLTFSFVGDCVLGRDIEGFGYSRTFDAKYDEVKDYNYFFNNVKSVLESDDFTIANLEGPLTDSNKEAYPNKKWHFKGSMDYANILAAGSVEAVNFANNHTYDYGLDGYNDTISALDNANVKHFGNGDVLIEEIKGVKVAFIGIKSMSSFELMDGVDIDSEENDDELINLTPRKELDNAFGYLLDQDVALKIVYFHWGNEYEEEYNANQEYIAKYAISHGADLVVGSHPHILQGVETYKSTYIIYSLGNFVYGGHKNPRDYDTAIARVTFTLEDNKVVNTDLEMIPCSLSSSIGKNDYAPYIYDEAGKEKVLTKILERSKDKIVREDIN